MLNYTFEFDFKLMRFLINYIHFANNFELFSIKSFVYFIILYFSCIAIYFMITYKHKKNMDLYNDQIAYDSCKVYDMMTEDDMINFSLNLVSAGKLIYIIFGYEYVSQSVYYIETNTTVETKTTADLYAYTNTNIPFNIPKTVYTTVSKVPGGTTIRP